MRVKGRTSDYSIGIGDGVLSSLGETVRSCLPGERGRIALISNKKVFELYGKVAVDGLKGAGFDVKPWFMGEGERFKSESSLRKLLEFLSVSGFERSDGVVALGGGVVGDLAGFGAALFLRGLALIQVPTTLLSQIDSSVGGKTAINTRHGKNLIGAFHQPRAVVIDTDTLRSLPRRELTAGWCEAVKQGAAGDRLLFDRTVRFLGSTTRRPGELEKLIADQCSFKARIVAGDEFEAIDRKDSRSRKILNFGHTTGHALEAVTAYRRFRHGEAVGYGMIVAGELSKRLGLLDASELESLIAAVRACGRLPRSDDLDAGQILEKIGHDKKFVRGKLNWVLIDQIGRAVIVDGKEISSTLLRASLRSAFRWNQ